MPLDIRTLETLIRQHIPDADVRIEDLRGDGDHYSLYVVSPSFVGKSRIQQHQMVYAAVKDHDVHALAIQTAVPKE